MGMGDRAGVAWWPRKEEWVGAERTAKRKVGLGVGERAVGLGVTQSGDRVRDSGNQAHRGRAGVHRGHGGAEESEERGDRQLLCPWGAGWVIPCPSR